MAAAAMQNCRSGEQGSCDSSTKSSSVVCFARAASALHGRMGRQNAGGGGGEPTRGKRSDRANCTHTHTATAATADKRATCALVSIAVSPPRPKKGKGKRKKQSARSHSLTRSSVKRCYHGNAAGATSDSANSGDALSNAASLSLSFPLLPLKQRGSRTNAKRKAKWRCSYTLVRSLIRCMDVLSRRHSARALQEHRDRTDRCFANRPCFANRRRKVCAARLID